MKTISTIVRAKLEITSAIGMILLGSLLVIGIEGRVPCGLSSELEIEGPVDTSLVSMRGTLRAWSRSFVGVVSTSIGRMLFVGFSDIWSGTCVESCSNNLLASKRGPGRY